MNSPACAVHIGTTPQGLRAVTLRSPHLSVTVLPDKGADIYALTDHRTGIDVLWKSPQGLRPPGAGRPAADSATAWLEMYEGGWQEMLPNGGDACQYQGVELNFHGESTTLPWQFAIAQAEGERAEVEFSVRLFRSPFILRRHMAVSAESATLYLQENVTNWAAVPMDFMWGHHPAFGAPFLSARTRLETNARAVLVDDAYDPPGNVFQPGARSAWPYALAKDGQYIDLRPQPGRDERRDTLIYLTDFDGSPWYALYNPALPLGVGIQWDAAAFRCLWLWQEVGATLGFPWYGQAYTVAVEPWSSHPGFGLANVLERTRTQHTLAPGASLSAWLTVTLFESDSFLERWRHGNDKNDENA